MALKMTLTVMVGDACRGASVHENRIIFFHIHTILLSTLWLPYIAPALFCVGNNFFLQQCWMFAYMNVDHETLQQQKRVEKKKWWKKENLLPVSRLPHFYFTRIKVLLNFEKPSVYIFDTKDKSFGAGMIFLGACACDELFSDKWISKTT